MWLFLRLNLINSSRLLLWSSALPSQGHIRQVVIRVILRLECRVLGVVPRRVTMSIISNGLIAIVWKVTLCLGRCEFSRVLSSFWLTSQRLGPFLHNLNELLHVDALGVLFAYNEAKNDEDKGDTD